MDYYKEIVCARTFKIILYLWFEQNLFKFIKKDVKINVFTGKNEREKVGKKDVEKNVKMNKKKKEKNIKTYE